jgi:hypothetical protein
MGVDIMARFYTKEKVTKKFIQNVVDAAEKSNGEYDGDEKLEEIIKKILTTKSAGFSYFLPFKNEWIIDEHGIPLKPKRYTGIHVSIYIRVEEGYTTVTIYTPTTNLMEAAENEDLFFALIRNIVKAVNPVFGFVDNENAFEGVPGWENPVANYLNTTKIYHVSWILFFGDKYIKKFDKEYLLKTPALLVEEIGNGILIVGYYIYTHKELKQENDFVVYENYLKKILGK